MFSLPYFRLPIGFLATVVSVISVIGITVTYFGASKGKIVTRGRIQNFGILTIAAGFIQLFGDVLTGIVLIAAGILFLASLKTFALAKVSVVLGLISLVTMFVFPAVAAILLAFRTWTWNYISFMNMILGILC